MARSGRLAAGSGELSAAVTTSRGVRGARGARSGVADGHHGPVRPDRQPGSADVDANRVGLAVPIARVGFDAEQVVPGHLGGHALEHARSGACDVEQGAARGRRQRLETVPAFAPILRDERRVERTPRPRHVGRVALQPERVDAGAGGGREPADLGDAAGIVALVVREKSLRHQQQRLRRVDRPEIGEHVAQAPERQVRIEPRLAGHLLGLGLNFLPAQLDGALRARAIAHDDLAERDLVAPIDRERRGEAEVVRAAAELLLLLLTRQQRERALQLIVVGHERRRLGAGAEPDDRDAVSRGQPIDERFDGVAHRPHLAERNVRLVDHEHDEPAARRLFVRHVAVGQRRRGGGACRAGGRGTHCALSTRRGRPSSRTVKSEAMRSRIGSPRPFTTVTSSGSVSTPDRNTGCGGVCGG